MRTSFQNIHLYNSRAKSNRKLFNFTRVKTGAAVVQDKQGTRANGLSHTVDAKLAILINKGLILKQNK